MLSAAWKNSFTLTKEFFLIFTTINNFLHILLVIIFKNILQTFKYKLNIKVPINYSKIISSKLTQNELLH